MAGRCTSRRAASLASGRSRSATATEHLPKSCPESPPAPPSSSIRRTPWPTAPGSPPGSRRPAESFIRSSGFSVVRSPCLVLHFQFSVFRFPFRDYDPSTYDHPPSSCRGVLRVVLPGRALAGRAAGSCPVSYTHLRAHETRHDLVCRLLLEKKKK